MPSAEHQGTTPTLPLLLVTAAACRAGLLQFLVCLRLPEALALLVSSLLGSLWSASILAPMTRCCGPWIADGMCTCELGSLRRCLWGQTGSMCQVGTIQRVSHCPPHSGNIAFSVRRPICGWASQPAWGTLSLGTQNHTVSPYRSPGDQNSVWREQHWEGCAVQCLPEMS